MSLFKVVLKLGIAPKGFEDLTFESRIIAQQTALKFLGRNSYKIEEIGAVQPRELGVKELDDAIETTTPAQAKILAECTIGRVLRMGARKEQPGDNAEFTRCRDILVGLRDAGKI